MKASHEDGFRLLQKWNAERTSIFALLTLGSDLAFSLKVSGFVTAFSPDILISEIATAPFPRPPKNHIMVPGILIQSFEYGESKDMPSLSKEAKDNIAKIHGVSCLQINFVNGVRLFIFEMSDENAGESR